MISGLYNDTIAFSECFRRAMKQKLTAVRLETEVVCIVWRPWIDVHVNE